MTITEAKQLVQKFPKQIGTYKRKRLNNLKRIIEINYMEYRDGNKFGFATGDGHVYGCKITQTDSGKVVEPDTSKILA